MKLNFPNFQDSGVYMDLDPGGDSLETVVIAWESRSGGSP